MKTLYFDGETALDNEAAERYFQLRSIAKRTLAPQQHARVADRRAALLRDAIHRVDTAMRDDGVQMSFKRLLGECVFCTNTIWSYGGASPYNALFGRQPAMLPDLHTLPDDAATDAPEQIRHCHRLRERAIQAIV
eukprot:407984-Amphidinium_carterae.1